MDSSNNSNMVIRLGSALLEKGKIIKTGCNRNDRSQWHGITMPGIHAEMNVTHSISPYSRPKNYRRLWSSKDSTVADQQSKLCSQRGQCEKVRFEEEE